MEFALAVNQIWRHRVWLAPIAVLAVVAGLAVTYHTTLWPPSLQSKSFEYGSAAVQVLAQPANPEERTETATSSVTSPEQASIYAALLQTITARREIGRAAGLPWRRIAVSKMNGLSEADAARRSSELVAQDKSYAVFFGTDTELPLVEIYAQAPTAAQARQLAIGAVASLHSGAGALQRRNHTPPSQWTQLVQLGPPETGTLAEGASGAVGLLVAFALFGAGCLGLVLIPRFVTTLRRARAIEAVVDWPIPPAGEGIESNGSSRHLDASAQGSLAEGE